MSTVARYVLIGMALALLLAQCAEADYSLQLFVGRGEEKEMVHIETYRHLKQCEMVKNQYQLGKVRYGDALTQPIGWGVCLPCEKWPEFCKEGI